MQKPTLEVLSSFETTFFILKAVAEKKNKLLLYCMKCKFAWVLPLTLKSFSWIFLQIYVH